jgi:glutamate-1-semialdehyde aminotransferase
LVFDEVVTGFRWGLGGAQKHYGVTPDLACFGKAMANGMPISAIAGKRSLMSELDHAFFSMTFGGECLSLAASIATINELKDKNYDHIWNLGDVFRTGINNAADSFGLEVNFAGSSPRHNLTFSEKYDNPTLMRDVFYQEMVKQNILFSNVLYLNFSHTEVDIRKTVDAAYNSFEFVDKNIDNLERVLEGKQSVSIFRKNT